MYLFQTPKRLCVQAQLLGSKIVIVASGKRASRCGGDWQRTLYSPADGRQPCKQIIFGAPLHGRDRHILIGDRRQHDHCLAAGCDDFTAKPIDRNTLVAVVRRWLPAPISAAAMS